MAQTCKELDILFVADEVITGFGRTGPMFACDAEGVEPELPGAGVGAIITTVALTGVVATVTKVTVPAFFAAAGVDPDFPGATAAEVPPLEVVALAVH